MEDPDNMCIRCGTRLNESPFTERAESSILPMCIVCFHKENNVVKPKFDEEKKIFKGSKINEKIYLGNEFDSRNKAGLKELGVTHILVAGSYLYQHHPAEFKYKSIMLDDTPWDNIKKFFNECIEFIDNAEKVFVHCAAGVSRSPSIVIAYLMKKEKLTFDEAFDLVKSKRCIVYPNPGFIRQLKEFYEEECCKK